VGYVITSLNLKGGVGKTSLCHHGAGALAKGGLKVLLVDNDPQSSLTQGFWGPGSFGQLDPAETVVALYDPDRLPSPSSLIRPTGIEGIDIVPSSPALAEINTTPAREWSDHEGGPREFLDQIRDRYNLILIDNPPNLYLCAHASLVASDALVVPLQPEEYGVQGLSPVRSAAERVRSTVNPNLRLLGYLITMFDTRLALHQTYDGILREAYGTDVFTNRVPRAKDFPEAVAGRVPVCLYKPRSAATKAVQAVVDEMVVRIGSVSQGQNEGVAA
jgi:chromosome partitioning protein